MVNVNIAAHAVLLGLQIVATTAPLFELLAQCALAGATHWSPAARAALNVVAVLVELCTAFGAVVVFVNHGVRRVVVAGRSCRTA